MTTPDRVPAEGSDHARVVVGRLDQQVTGGERAQVSERVRRSRRAPDFFLVGHIKCGTTALARMLSQHDAIYIPVKEPKFFAPELRSRFARFGPRKLPFTLEGYTSLFDAARPDQRIGDASPHYLMSSEAARRIAEVQPGAQIVAIFREPTSFLRSLHLQAVHNYVENQKHFEKAIGLEHARRRGKRIPLLSQAPPFLFYSEHVRYVEQLQRFHAHFPADQIRVLIYDDFRGDNDATVREVMRFLQVDDTVPIASVETRRLKDVRSMRLHQLNGLVSVTRRNLSRRLPALSYKGQDNAFQALRRRIVYAPAAPPDEALMLDLRRRFKPEVVALSEYLGRDLVSLWGYDEIG